MEGLEDDPPAKGWANPSKPWTGKAKKGKEKRSGQNLFAPSTLEKEKEEGTREESGEDPPWAPYGVGLSHSDSADGAWVLFFLEAHRDELDKLYEGPTNWGEWIKTELYLKTNDPGLAQTEVLAESRANRLRLDRYVQFAQEMIREGDRQRIFVITRYEHVRGFKRIGEVEPKKKHLGSRSDKSDKYTYTVWEYSRS